MQNRTITSVVGGLGAAALIALGMATSLPHLGAAQDPGQPPPAGRMGGRGPGGRGMGRGGPGGGPGMTAGIDPRDLTDAQREQLKTIRQNHAADVKAAMDHVEKAHQALADAVVTGSGDIGGLSQAVGAAEGEMAFQNARIETEAMALLTPDQKQKIQDRRKEMAARRAEMEQRRLSRGTGSGNAK